MKTCGIIVEYNPLHNGHIRHIRYSREVSGCDCLIAVMSGHFTQRGEPTVADKFARTEAALLHGVDLVVELPNILCVQNGSVFGGAAVELLKMAGVSDIVFGSETGNLEELEDIAKLPINVENLKEKMRTGESFPKAYGLLADYIYPNDRLAVSYLRALQGTSITAHALRRNSDYRSETMSIDASASAIRKAIAREEDYSFSTPMNIPHPVFAKDLYPFLRRVLLIQSREELQKRFLVSEGIEKLMRDNASLHADYDDFINACVNRRYTRSRIQRTALQIMLHNTKEEVLRLQEPTYLRILGFNKAGQKFLASRKDELHTIARFKEIPPTYKLFEERANELYASLFREERRKELLKRELQGPIIIR